MKSIHDNNIYSIEIQCEKERIILHTEFREDSPEYTDVVFSGVAGHKFEDVLKGNIIYDVEEQELPLFYEEFEAELAEYRRYGLPLQFTNSQEFIDIMTEKNLKAYIIESSYGLSGWVISRGMELIDRKQRCEA